MREETIKKNEKKIRFGLTAIKGLGEETVERIMQERLRNGNFVSLDDLAKRLPARLMNKKTLEALAFSGALDVFGDRKAIVNSLEDLSKFAREQEDSEASGQIGLFDLEESVRVDFELRAGKASPEEILAWEKSSLGLYVSSHPLKGLENYFAEYGTLIGDIDLKETGSKKIILHGLVNNLRKIITKKGKPMAIFELEDTSTKIECAVFPMVYEKIKAERLVEDAFVKIKGKAEEKEGTLNCIVEKITFGDLKALKKTLQETDKIPKKPENDLEWREIIIPKTLPQEKLTAVKNLLLSKKIEKIPAKEALEPRKDFKNIILVLGEKKIEVPFIVDYDAATADAIQQKLK